MGFRYSVIQISIRIKGLTILFHVFSLCVYMLSTYAVMVVLGPLTLLLQRGVKITLIQRLEERHIVQQHLQNAPISVLIIHAPSSHGSN